MLKDVQITTFPRNVIWWGLEETAAHNPCVEIQMAPPSTHWPPLALSTLCMEPTQEASLASDQDTHSLTTPAAHSVIIPVSIVEKICVNWPHKINTSQSVRGTLYKNTKFKIFQKCHFNLNGAQDWQKLYRSYPEYFPFSPMELSHAWKIILIIQVLEMSYLTEKICCCRYIIYIYAYWLYCIIPLTYFLTLSNMTNLDDNLVCFTWICTCHYNKCPMHKLPIFFFRCLHLQGFHLQTRWDMGRWMWLQVYLRGWDQRNVSVHC